MRTIINRDWAPIAVSGVLVGGLAAPVFVPARDLPVGFWLAVIYAVVFAVGMAGTFFGPSRMAVIPDVVHGDAEIVKASGITQSTDALAGMVGPPLAAPLLFAGGVHWTMIVNALSYAVSYLAVRPVPIPDHTAVANEARPPDFWAEFKAGLAVGAGAALPVVFLTAMPIAMVNTALEPLVIQVTPRAMPGRVVSVFMPVMSIVQLGSTVPVGWLPRSTRSSCCRAAAV